MERGTYRTQDGSWAFFRQDLRPWRQRSTVNDSPLWGVREGWTGAHRFFHKRSHIFWNIRAFRRLRRLAGKRRSPTRFFPGCHEVERR